MEFWGVEVKSGESLKVSPGEEMLIHLSQACIGEIEKENGNEAVYLFVNIDGKKLVLGTLLTENLPQQQFDLVFDRDFELSHSFKSASVFFYGYKTDNPIEDGPDDELVNVEAKPKQEKPVDAAKALANAGKGKDSDSSKQKVKIVEPKKDLDDESSDDDLMSDDGDEDDSQDEDDSESESDEETPTKAEPSKKRPAESATKTLVQNKKAKATPQKTAEKKPVHVATPHPAKRADVNKPNQQTSKSGGSHSCKTCNRTFNSDQALASHTKAKHAAAGK